jgi:hypothetical protein
MHDYSLCYLWQAKQEVDVFCPGHCWPEVLIEVMDRGCDLFHCAASRPLHEAVGVQYLLLLEPDALSAPLTAISSWHTHAYAGVAEHPGVTKRYTSRHE